MARSSLMMLNPDEMIDLMEVMINKVREYRPDSSANEVLDVIVATAAVLGADVCQVQPESDQMKLAKEIGDVMTSNILLMLEIT